MQLTLHVGLNNVLLQPVNIIYKRITQILSLLTHLPLVKMAAMSQTTFSITYYWIETAAFRFKIALKFIPKDPVDFKSVSSGNGLAPNRRQAITWTYTDPIDWRIYAALGEIS